MQDTNRYQLAQRCSSYLLLALIVASLVIFATFQRSFAQAEPPDSTPDQLFIPLFSSNISAEDGTAHNVGGGTVSERGTDADAPIFAASHHQGEFLEQIEQLDSAAWQLLGTSETRLLTGDINGDSATDYLLVKSRSGTISTLISDRDGFFIHASPNMGDFHRWLPLQGVEVHPGDYNGDGLMDLALLRRVSGWGSLPVAFAQPDGTFHITNYDMTSTYQRSFLQWMTHTNVEVVQGDFNGDNNDDLLLVHRSPAPTNTVLIALSDGNGSFTVLNRYIDSLDRATQPNVHIIAGHFNQDSATDLLFVRQDAVGWTHLMLAYYDGISRFTVVKDDPLTADPADWAKLSGMKIIPGDYNGDQKTDLLFVRQEPGWQTVRILMTDPTHGFKITENLDPEAATLAEWASTSDVQIIPGDYNGDQKTDLLFARPVIRYSGFHPPEEWQHWTSTPVVISQGNGNFSNQRWLPTITHAGQSDTYMTTGDFNGDGATDIGKLPIRIGGLLNPGSRDSVYTAFSNPSVQGRARIAATRLTVAAAGEYSVNLPCSSHTLGSDGEHDIRSWNCEKTIESIGVPPVPSVLIQVTEKIPWEVDSDGWTPNPPPDYIWRVRCAERLRIDLTVRTYYQVCDGQPTSVKIIVEPIDLNPGPPPPDPTPPPGNEQP